MFVFPVVELSVTLNIIHDMVYFPGPQREVLVHVRMDGSVIWPGARSSSQSKQEGVAEGPGLLEESRRTPTRGRETSSCMQTHRKA